MRIVFLGLSLSSSWGNGHASTYRSLLKGLHESGHDVLFLEREQPWYASNRDLPVPGFCDFQVYQSCAELDRYHEAVTLADAVIIGSYVPDGLAVIEWVDKHRRGLLCFYDIDTPITVQGLAGDSVAYLTPRLIPWFDLYLSFTGGPTLRILRDVYHARRAVPLYCSVDPALYHPTGAAKRWDLGYLGTYSPDRQDALDRLLLEPARRLPERRFVVAGPQYPADIAWPDNVERIEHLSPSEHAAFYSSSNWTLNVTRRDMISSGYSPSVRLFEATACGVPVLSDQWPGIEDVLTPAHDLLVVNDTAEVIEALAFPDDRRVAIGSAGRARTLRNHTGRQRAEELIRHLAAARF
ncbi:CgeB family protein [Rhodopila sp.]|uniref:CgeB family protein n=1 Tax=Rhodopila sp. TaxID=2480087 RepID=UPI003D138236